MTTTFELIRWQATDGVELTGFLAGGRRTRVAIYLHGLGGNGYRSAMVPALAVACGRKGIGLFSINTRGHDVVSACTRGERRTNTNGAVYEIFTASLHDLRGAIAALRSRGVRTVYLIGHSTGANKIAYALQRGKKETAVPGTAVSFLRYPLRVHGVRVAAAVYLAPGDDIGTQQQLLGQKRYRAMQRLAKRWQKKSPHRLMPVQNLGYLDISAASYHSLYGERNHMDQFPFRTLQPTPRWRRLAGVRTPTLMVLGADDAWLPASARAIQQFFSAHYPHVAVCTVARANHSFYGSEAAMARRVSAWLPR